MIRSAAVRTAIRTHPERDPRGASPQEITMDSVVSFIRQNKDRYVSDLVEFLKIPSVSSNSSNKKDVEQCAHFVAELMRKAGLKKVELHATPGHPIVYGEWC